MNEILMGNEAVALGLIEAGCSVLSAYPGTPSSEILPYAAKLKKQFDLPIFVEWSVNEKCAFELVYANSIIGGNSAVIMKQVGLNVAMDSLMSAAYIGHTGGMVVVVADDPGPVSSQTEQDSRFAAMFAKLPVFDPSSPEEAREFAKEAMLLSRQYQIPVILRITGRIAHWKTNITFNAIDKTTVNRNVSFDKNPLRWAAIPKFRHLQHIELNKKLQTISDSDDFYFHLKKSKTNTNLIITSGVCYSHIRDALDFLDAETFVDIVKVNIPFPVSEKVKDIATNYDRIIVIEEMYPVIEYQLRNIKINGRLTGEIPKEGELTINTIIDILKKFFKFDKKTPETFSTTPKKPELCAGCPHRNSFYAIKKAFPNGIYPSDIGCYTLGLNMGAVDTCLCMGATVNQASGFYQGFKTNGKEIPPIIATIGDSTFFHGGVSGLINAVYQKSAFVLVILDNSTVAMTGFQPTPENGILNSGKGNSVSIEKLIQGCGVEKLAIINPSNIENTVEVIRKFWDYSIKNEKVSVVIAKAPCAILAKKEGMFGEIKVTIDDSCTNCSKCINDFQCPAIYSNGKKAEIDYSICIGCGVCMQVCPVGAIKNG